MTLFYSGAIPNDTARSLCRKLHLEAHKTRLCITRVRNNETLAVDKVSQLAGTVLPVMTGLFCFVVKSCPYSLIVIHASKKMMHASLDFDRHKTSCRQIRGNTQIPLITERSQCKSAVSDELELEKESN